MVATSALTRVVVTGMGVVAPNGQSVEQFWSSLREGRTGLSPFENVGPEHLRHMSTTTLGGQIKGFDQKARLKHLKRDKILPYAELFSWLAAAATHEAVTQSGLALPADNPERVAVIIGSANGGQATIETASRDHNLRNMKATHPLVLIRLIASSAAAHVGIEYGAKGPVMGLSSGCASADHSIILGADYIRRGQADIAIVGGTEAAISFAIVLAMQSMNLLTHDAPRPFSANRSGTALSEAAGVLVLESENHAVARGANILAELSGSGMTGSASDPLAPAPETAARAMVDALRCAGKLPSAVSYLNAHGIGTPAGDAAETIAIKTAFAGHAPALSISATKPLHGYAIGATGALEAIACVKAIETGFVPPTVGLNTPDPACDLDFTPGIGRQRDIECAMSTTIALDGIATSLVFSRYRG